MRPREWDEWLLIKAGLPPPLLLPPTSHHVFDRARKGQHLDRELPESRIISRYISIDYKLSSHRCGVTVKDSLKANINLKG